MTNSVFPRRRSLPSGTAALGALSVLALLAAPLAARALEPLPII
ncbi:hypothetical protein [Burkholderia sp. Ac-20379]|nr:hypothetical protein [Burkholderia sp. Ac-20379]